MMEERILKLIDIVKDLSLIVKETNSNCVSLQKQITLQQEQIDILKNKL